MSDTIQEKLDRVHRYGDRKALAEVFAALKVQFVGPVARFLKQPPSASATDQALGDILVDLLLGKDGKPPRALAPPDHPNAAAWRRQVLLRALIDRQRRQSAYAKAVMSHSQQLAHEQEGTGRCLPEELLELSRMRGSVVARLPQLDVRRRIVLALELRIALAAGWVTELARALAEPAEGVLVRLHEHEQMPEDEQRKLAILYGPTTALSTAREAYRKTLERAREDMAALIRGGRS